MTLKYKSMKKNERNYAIQLARNEINIEPKRLDQYKTYLIYHDKKRIGFVSFGFKSDQTIYIYILAFEKDAQRKGFASTIFDSLIKYGQKQEDRFKGLSATIHKVNIPAINAATKHGFNVTNERTRYLDFMKPAN